MMLVRWKSVVDVTIRIGQRRDGSNPGGKLKTARPVSGRGFPPCAATSWKYFETGKRISTRGPGFASLPAIVAAPTFPASKSGMQRESASDLVIGQSIGFCRIAQFSHLILH